MEQKFVSSDEVTSLLKLVYYNNKDMSAHG